MLKHPSHSAHPTGGVPGGRFPAHPLWFATVGWVLAVLCLGCSGTTPESLTGNATDTVTTPGDPLFSSPDVTLPDATTSPDVAPDVTAWFPDVEEEKDYGWAIPSDTGSPIETSGLPTCGDQTVSVVPPPQPASVLLVLDRSGSMSTEGKWEMAVQALGDVLDVVGPSFHFGLLLYPQEANTCILTPSPHVPFGLSHGALIVDTMTTLGTSHGTPTSGALAAALGIFEDQAPTDTRALIITTDGEPNCPHTCTGCETLFAGDCGEGICGNCANENTCTSVKVLQGVSDLADIGVSTYVIGLPGSENATSLLDEMAELGGTALDGPVKHYDITSGGSLGETLIAITETLGKCTVELEPPVGYAFLTVEVNGVSIPHDPAGLEGWSLTDSDTLQFHGSACSAASEDGANVSVSYVCKYAEE